MPSKRSASGPTPLQTYEDLLNFAWGGLALGAAVELDLFSHIAAGSTSAEQVAAAAGASEHGTRRLLDALCGMGYLKKSGQNYKLQRSAAEHLVRGKPLYMGDAAMIGKMLMGPWSMLTEVVKSGSPVQSGASAEERGAFFAKLVPAIFPASFLAATAMVKRLPPAARRRISRILDIGAGAAAWSIPFAKALKRARVTVADLPGGHASHPAIRRALGRRRPVRLSRGRLPRSRFRKRYIRPCHPGPYRPWRGRRLEQASAQADL